MSKCGSGCFGSSTKTGCRSVKKHSFGQVIGEGTYSKVYVAKNKSDSELYAIKAIDLDLLTNQAYQLVMEEVNFLKEDRHENIIRVIEDATCNSYLCLKMDLMHHRSCDYIIAQKHQSGLPEAAIGIITKSVMNALHYLHGKAIVYSGLRASHILIDQVGNVRLTGFRNMSAIPINEMKITNDPLKFDLMKDSLHWLSPEILAQGESGFNCLSDIYSLGVLVVELGNGIVPFAGVTPRPLLIKKLKETRPRLYDKSFLPSYEEQEITPGVLIRRPSYESVDQESESNQSNDEQQIPECDAKYIQKSYTNLLHRFIQLCLVKDPVGRPTIDQVMNLSFSQLYSHSDPCDLLDVLTLPSSMRIELGPVTKYPWSDDSHRKSRPGTSTQ